MTIKIPNTMDDIPFIIPPKIGQELTHLINPKILQFDQTHRDAIDIYISLYNENEVNDDEYQMYEFH